MAKYKIKGKKITGTKKKDKIVSTGKGIWKKAFTVNAGNGNDIINFKKSKYKNVLNGQNGNDKIYGGNKNDKITGGKGNDTIYTGKGTNTLIVNKGDGNDIIYHQGTKTVIKVNGAKANDTQSFEKKGNDLLLTYTHGGTTVKEVLTFKDYYKGNKNIFLGSQKIENLINTKGLIISGNGNIQGSNYNDIINGGNGNDSIYAGAGNDVINAGKGNNTIYIKKNEGTDTILSGGGTDKIVFTDAASIADITAEWGVTNTNDLILKSGNTSIILPNYKSGNHSAKTVSYGSGNVSKDIKKVAPKLSVVNEDDDVEVEGSDFGDEITSHGDSVTIYGGDGDDIINSYGPDHIYGQRGDDTINLYENVNKNIYIAPDDGNDEISGIENTAQTNIDFDSSSTFWTDKNDEGALILKSLAYKNGQYYEQETTIDNYYNGESINASVADKLTINGSAFDVTTLKNPVYMAENTHTSTEKEFTYGTTGNDTITASDGNDTIYGNGGNDVINGKGGNDVIYLGSGNSTVKVDMSMLTGEVQQEGTEYEWIDYKENGVKTIYMQNDSVLTLDFAKEIFDNGCEILCRGTGQDNNLYISLSNSDNPPYGIVIKDYFDENGNPKTDNVKFNIWGDEETPETYTVPEWTNAMLMPWYRVFDVQPFGPYEGEIRGTNMPHEALLYSAGFGDDTIYGGNGNEENIFLHGGNDVIYANEGIKHLNISGNTTDCEIHLGSAETTKTSINLGLVEGNVTSSINAAGDLNVSWECYANNALEPYVYSSTLSVVNWNNRTSEALFSIGGNNRDNTLNGINGADNIIDGGEGDDTLIGGTGVDTFNFTSNNGYGIDTVKNYTANDILRFESASSYGVDFTKFKYYTNDNGKGLVINTKDLGNKDSYVIIDNYFESDNKIDTVTTYNWSSPDETKSLATMYGNKDDMGSFDVGTGGIFAGTDNVDVFVAKSGTNTYTGGKGADTFYSRDGVNTFVFNTGDGSDTLNQEGGTITLKFNDATIGELASKTGYDRNGDDLLIHYDGENTLRVKDFYWSGHNHVAEIIDSTGTSYTATDCFKKVVYYNSSTKGYETSKDSEEIRVTTAPLTGDVAGKKGSDRIYGGDGDEWLYTFTVMRNDGTINLDTTPGTVDEIYGGAGDDYIIGQSETNYLYGDSGDDTFIVFVNSGLNTYISDSQGTADDLNIYDETYDNIHFVFNVNSGGIIDDAGLRVLNNDNFNLWKTNVSNANVKGISIKGQWDAIDTYEEAGDENGCYHLSVTALQTVKATVAGWLADNGYTDVADVIANEKTEGDINTLIAKFDVADKWTYVPY